MLTAGTDRYGAVHSPLFASILLIASPPKLPDDVTLSQFFPPGGGLFRPDNFPNVFLGAARSFECCSHVSRCIACIWLPDVTWPLASRRKMLYSHAFAS